MDIQEKNSTSVLIVGAGQSGMLTARHVSTIRNVSITVIEAKSSIGGLWAQDEITELHPKANKEKKIDNYYKLNNCFQASIYPNLIANEPKDFMSYKDFTLHDFDPTLPDFITPEQFLRYQNAYWDHFDLKKHINFNTIVKSIRPYENLTENERAQIRDKEPRKFVVITADAKAKSLSQNEKVSTYDYVIVCTGTNSKPHIPHTEGIDRFKGLVMHSKDFREPDEPMYQDKKILVLGGSYSAIDMVVQFFHNRNKGRQKLQKMILCGNDISMLEKSRDFQPLKEEGAVMAKKGWITEVTEDSVVFTDGTTEQVDIIMYCTGYELSYPFFNPEDKMVEMGGEECRRKFFGGLYKRFIAIQQPKLFFLGLPDVTDLWNYITEIQAMMIKHVIDGSLKLPSKEEMINEFEKDVAEERASSKDGSLKNFFRLSMLKGDLVYIESLRKELQHLYPGSEEKAKKALTRKVEMCRKAVEFFDNGNLLQYWAFDFSGTFPEEVKDTSEFI